MLFINNCKGSIVTNILCSHKSHMQIAMALSTPIGHGCLSILTVLHHLIVTMALISTSQQSDNGCVCVLCVFYSLIRFGPGSMAQQYNTCLVLFETLG